MQIDSLVTLTLETHALNRFRHLPGRRFRQLYGGATSYK